ncbi:hypothetical protein [Coleofasciculus sp. E1-EBD-02]|uniref:hypothetical protein n=1 Tax=Coleofasciculus sp. E1-EBD-02 TaxID=3068481 RepID=UPI0033031F4D
MNYNQNFLHDINQQLFPRDITDKNLRERIFFPLRFQRRESQPSHPEIAKQMRGFRRFQKASKGLV